MAVMEELLEAEDVEWAQPTPPPPEYFRDSRWISAHISELTDRYPDQWIGVVDRQVIAAGRDAGAVRREAQAKTGQTQVVMRLMQTGPWPCTWRRW